MCDVRAWLDWSGVDRSSAATHRFAILVHLVVSVAPMVVFLQAPASRLQALPRPASDCPLDALGRGFVEASGCLLAYRFELWIDRRGQAWLGCTGCPLRFQA